MTTEVQIANRALQKLGARRIESLTEDSANARSVAAAYEPVRDRLLRVYEWNFAKKRGRVAADPDKTLWGGVTRFRKPNDFLRLARYREIGTGAQDQRTIFQIEGDYIVSTEDAPLEFVYIAKVKEPAKFDALFAELLAVSIAAEIADDITSNASRVERVIQEKMMLETEARGVNALENPEQTPPEDDWVLARL